MNRWQRPYLILCGAVALIAAGIAIYSQTNAYAFDEGFHLLAAQLIKRGKTPYLDFFFGQVPLNAWWNAAWMRVFPESWRTAHAVAAAEIVAAVFLAADFVFDRFRLPRWQLPVSLAAVLLIGTNWRLVEFGPIAQAYALCLLLLVVSFRLATRAVDRSSMLLTALAGCAVGAAAASSLLTAPAAPVLLLWILVYRRTGSRLLAAACFTGGAAVPWLPILRLFLKSPLQVRFGIFDYHFWYRQVEWANSLRHNLEMMVSWINSTQAVILALLAIAGLWYVARASGWERSRRAEFYLCGWLAAALIAYLCYIRPSFVQYFSLAVPFLAIPASVGLYAVGSRLGSVDRAWAPFGVLALLLCCGTGKYVYDDASGDHLSKFEHVAQKVDQVTPRGGSLLADEFIYFMTRRPPPSGMEYSDSHKLRLPAALAAKLHVVPRPELVRLVKAGTYDTAESCDDDDDENLVQLGLPDIYAQNAEIEGCKVYWERKAGVSAQKK